MKCPKRRQRRRIFEPCLKTEHGRKVLPSSPFLPSSPVLAQKPSHRQTSRRCFGNIQRRRKKKRDTKISEPHQTTYLRSTIIIIFLTSKTGYSLLKTSQMSSFIDDQKAQKILCLEFCYLRFQIIPLHLGVAYFLNERTGETAGEGDEVEEKENTESVDWLVQLP